MVNEWQPVGDWLTIHYCLPPCDYDICAKCGISRFSHNIVPLPLIACDSFEYSEDGRCEICAGKVAADQTTGDT